MNTQPHVWNRSYVHVHDKNMPIIYYLANYSFIKVNAKGF